MLRTSSRVLYLLLCMLFMLNFSFHIPNSIHPAKPCHGLQVPIRFSQSICEKSPRSLGIGQKPSRGIIKMVNHHFGLSLTVSHEDHDQTAATGPAKYRRMFRFSLENQLLLSRLDILTTLVPVQGTAAILEHFYSSILHEVNTIWGLSPPLNPVVLTHGPLELSLAMRGGEIPWRIVAELVEYMLDLTRAQLTHTYHMYWETPDKSASLSVLLKILPEPAPDGL